jgi:hypothetical protein
VISERFFEGDMDVTLQGNDEESKMDELVALSLRELSTEFGEHSDSLTDPIIRKYFQSGITIRPPQFHLPEIEKNLEMFRVRSGNLGSIFPDVRDGASVKAGNVRIDMQRLLVAGAQTVRDVVTTVKNPWLLPASVLILWDRIWALVNIPITEKEACLIWVMWMNADANQTVAEARLLEQVNAERSRWNHDNLTSSDLKLSLDKLEKIKAIERYKRDPSRWWLREYVSINYT